MAVADAATGSVHNPPVAASDGDDLALPMLVFPESAGGAADVEYHVDSRLMIVRATPHSEKSEAVSYAFYFLWQGNRWKLLRCV
jgi:hypothetical protein